MQRCIQTVHIHVHLEWMFNASRINLSGELLCQGYHSTRNYRVGKLRWSTPLAKAPFAFSRTFQRQRMSPCVKTTIGKEAHPCQCWEKHCFNHYHSGHLFVNVKSISQTKVRQNLLSPKGIHGEDWEEQFLLVLRYRFWYDHSKNLKKRLLWWTSFFSLFFGDYPAHKKHFFNRSLHRNTWNFTNWEGSRLFLIWRFSLIWTLKRNGSVSSKRRKKRDYTPYEDAKAYVSLSLSFSFCVSPSLSLSLSLSLSPSLSLLIHPLSPSQNSLRERERERERTETDVSDGTIVALKLTMSLHFPLPNICTFRFSLHTSFVSPFSNGHHCCSEIRNEFTLSVAGRIALFV